MRHRHIVLALLITATACLGKSEPADPGPLTVTETTPADGAMDVETNPTGVSISRAVAFVSTRFDAPNTDFWTSTAKRAKSAGVVQSPAAASSG